jgi:predicted porin
MNKKLLAVAVAGTFLAPAAALAQSSVTISGLLKGGYENVKYGNWQRTGKSSQNGVVDDSSRIVFNVVEDLGGGLQAIGQVDMRLKPDDAGFQAAPANVGGTLPQGNSHFGLRSKDWGRIFFGRQDLHYFNTETNIADKASLRSSSISLLSYVGAGAAAGPIANATRISNVVHYTTPNWGGFTAIVAYSSNPFAADQDLGSPNRSGSAWNINPNFAAANWQVGYSYWTAKPDVQGATAATTVMKQRGDRLYGSYVFPFGLKIGLAWDKAKQEGPTTTLNNRDAWSIPASYTWGNHSVHGHYSEAKDDKATSGLNDSAKMYAIAYAYDLSKRTSVALTYAQIKNNANGTYNFFTNGSLGVGASGAAAPAITGPAAGEDPKLFGLTLRHAF